ncbi:MAG: saccharopine dehydrogenase NADP-binding domain-containing protein [Marinosulfonomonas sp.]|nr:saccharopine dehydrogenase NADP-binding domain-containing protein [Marinosulfonomonas sp.]
MKGQQHISEGPTKTSASKIVVVGAGRAGEAILDLLCKDARFQPLAIDIDYSRVRAMREAGIAAEQASGSDAAQIIPILKGAAAVVCAAPPAVTAPLAHFAAEIGCHYVDMCEDLSAVEKVVAEAGESEFCFASGCGLAPGLVTLLVDTMIKEAPDGADITAFVGVLPAERTNRLGYGNLWGIDGLMAEYVNPCLAIENGEIVTGPPLQNLEQIQIGSESFEAFSTSGSLGDLAQYYHGKVQGLSFKTLRYPGHLDYIRFLLDDLKLSKRLYMFRNLLLNGLPKIERDRVIIHIIDRNPTRPQHQTRLFDAIALENGKYRSAVSSVAAQHVCAVIDIIVHGLAPCRGVLHHSDLTMDTLGRSRYGHTLLTSG